MGSPGPSLPVGRQDDDPRAGEAGGRSASHAVELRFPARTAVAVWVEGADELSHALVELGLSEPRPTLVVVGGADGLGPGQLDRLRPVFANALLPIVAAADGAIVDGGTDSGVMRLMGEAASRLSGRVPLVGVAAAATVAWPGDPTPGGKADLEPHHDHFVLVPGESWGDESEWLSLVATALAGPCPSVTVLLNGGETAWRDVEASVASGRPVIVLDGSGRAADEIAAALRSVQRGDRGDGLAATGLVEAVPLDPVGAALGDAVRARLGSGSP